MRLNDVTRLASLSRKTMGRLPGPNCFTRMTAGPWRRSQAEDGDAPSRRAPSYAASAGGDTVGRKRVPLLPLAFVALALLLVIVSSDKAHGQDTASTETAGLTVTMSADDHVVWRKGGKTTLRFTLSRPLETGESVTLPLKVSGGEAGEHWNLNHHAGAAVKRTGYGRKSELVIEAGGQEATLQFVGRKGDRKDRDITIRFGKGKRAPSAAGIDGALELQGSPLTITVARNQPTPPTPAQAPPVPAITISGGNDVTEGGAASFTITANPAPEDPLTVNIGVTEVGDFGVSGPTTVRVSGDTTLFTVSTINDDADELDGGVTATIQSGTGYAIGAAASATVKISDNDEPTPELTIGIYDYIGAEEGEDVVFLIKAAPAPASPITVNMKVTEDGNSGASGAKSITVSKAETIYRVSTTDDDIYEGQGYVRAWILPGEGYTVGSPSSSVGNVVNNDPSIGPHVSITSAADDVEEGEDVIFTLAASPAPDEPLKVTVQVSPLATTDYGVRAGNRTVTIPTSGSATLTVATSDDNVDEPDGSVTATIKIGAEYTISSPSWQMVEIKDNDADTFQVLLHMGKWRSIREGRDALYTIEVKPAPTGPITINMEVTENGDFGASGAQSITVTKAETTYVVSTTDDEIDEPDGYVRAWIIAGRGYNPGWPSAVKIDVLDNDGPSKPGVGITSATGTTEGGKATFTLTAIPAPTAALRVTVQVTAIGDYGVDKGQRTVIIPTSGSATLSVATVDDDKDEENGSVSVTVMHGYDKYVVRSPNTTRVRVTDND